MTKIASKGTALQLSISAVFTTVAQVTSIDGPDSEVETFDSTSLDSGVGKETDVTGFVVGGTVSGELFFDPVAATHQALTDVITAPAVSSWKIIWSDAASTEWPFSGVLKKLTPKAALAEGLTASFEIELDGMVTYPT